MSLPSVSLGLWHNFGGTDDFENARAILRCAFDAGITHFDLANNYGPPAGSAEQTLGRVLRGDLAAHRDEIIVATKAGHRMWRGPYGDGGSRRHLVASLDQSLARLGLDHVDIFYHHRPDPSTPLEETAEALAHVVRTGRALYVGISKYPIQEMKRMAALLRETRTPCLVHQARYNLFNRGAEDGLLDASESEGTGIIAFSPLAQGLLTERYLEGAVPADSRAARAGGFLRAEDLTTDRLAMVRALAEIARGRGQSLSQMALTWVFRQPAVCSALVGASRTQHVIDAVAALKFPALCDGELARIDSVLADFVEADPGLHASREPALPSAADAATHPRGMR